MKLLRNILIVLVAAVAVMYFMGPAENNIARSVNIEAPVSAVFPYAKSLKQMDRWSPWSKRDPKMVNTYEGTDGAVGSINRWEGNDEVGSGSQEVTKIVENELVETKLNFIKPFESTADASIKLAAAENGGTDVTWGFHSKNGFMEKIMFLFMDFEAMLGGDYEAGMASLKELVESEAKTASADFQINEIEYSGKKFIAVRETVKFDAIPEFYAENLPKVFGAAGDKVDGMPYGLYFKWDEENNQTEMAAAVAVTSDVSGYDAIEAEPGKALQLDYYGDYAGSAAAHYAMDNYMKAKGLEMRDMVMEQYITDPATEPDTSKWLTQITYLVK